jgi:hypothetical protein
MNWNGEILKGDLAGGSKNVKCQGILLDLKNDK